MAVLKQGILMDSKKAFAMFKPGRKVKIFKEEFSASFVFVTKRGNEFHPHGLLLPKENRLDAERV